MACKEDTFNTHQTDALYLVLNCILYECEVSANDNVTQIMNE